MKYLINYFRWYCSIVLVFCVVASAKTPAFRVFVLSENDPNHTAMVNGAKPWLQKLAADSNFSYDIFLNVDSVSDEFLSKYQLFFQLNWPPFRWTVAQEQALQRFVESGKGWVGMHTCGLTGTAVLSSGEHDWVWYRENFFGGVSFTSHPAFQSAKVIVEDSTHPVTKGLPKNFTISDEWYEFNGNPRSKVHVLARVDESTYNPNKRATDGDHPMVWTNDTYQHMLYIGMGHSPNLFNDANFTKLLRTAIMWAASPATGTNDPLIQNVTRPVSNHMHISGSAIQVSFNGIKAARVMLVDAIGRIVHQGFVENGLCTIDRAGLSRGVYFLTVNAASEKYAQKIVLSN